MDDCTPLESGLTLRKWSEPAYAEKRALKLRAQARGFGEGRPQSVVSAPGHWNACDAWITVPEDWADVVFALFAMNAEHEQLVDFATAAELASPVRTASGLSGILLRARGCAAERYELRAWGLAGELSDPSAYARLECWGKDDLPGAGRDGHLVVDGFARLHQQWQFSADVAIGTATIAAAHPLGGRSMLRHLTFSANAAATLLVETVDPAAVATRREFLDLAGRGTVVVDYGYPVRSGPGDFWRVTAVAACRLTAIGHYE